MTQRFYKDRLYHFKGEQWSRRFGRSIPYEIVIVGELVRTYIDPTARRDDFQGEWQPDGRTYRLADGHLPDYQPRVPAAALPALMGPQKIRFAHPVQE